MRQATAEITEAKAANSGTVRCPWCGQPFTPRRIGAHRKKFCSAACKDRFHTAARLWVQRAIARGRLSVADLKAAQASCTTQASAAKP